MTDILNLCQAAIDREHMRRGYYPSFAEVEPPSWVLETEDTRLRCLYDEQAILFSHGRVVWGQLVQANQLAFEPGPDDVPAAVLFTRGEGSSQEIGLLGRIAADLFRQKGKRATNPELDAIVRMITDEHSTEFNVELPLSVTENTRVYYTSTMIVRAHLPGGVLVSPWFPYLALPSHTRASLILPHIYWPDELRSAWLDPSFAAARAEG